MGLLSDTSGRGKVILFINDHGTKVSIISFLSGLVWMALLANHEFNAKNYFSENQLLPGMVETYFSNTHQFYKHLRELQKFCEKDTRNLIAHHKVKEEMEKLNLDVYEQHFHVISKGINGTNVYGIYRAPRASGVESIVLNIPNHGGCNSSAGIAMMLSLARFFRMQTYWAKDIVFLMTENELYGMKAWLSAYFEDHTPDIVSTHLDGHGGSIQAALTLDLESENIAYLDISINGLNGMLPNLDLVHLLVRIANFESIPVKLEFQNSMYVPSHDFKRSLETLLRNMAFQWSGIPSGNHGLFYKYRIEAYTLKSVTSNVRVRDGHPVDFESLGRYIEGVFRSMNNLLEHVHQSFFMYLLPNTNRYISIGLYMPPLACLVAPLLISLLQTWIILFNLDVKAKFGINSEVPISILADWSVLSYVMASFVMSWVWMNYGHGLFMDGKETSLETFCLFAFVALVIGSLKCIGLNVMNFYITLQLTAVIALTSLFNFSFAFFLAVVYVPSCLVIQKSSSGWLKLISLAFSVPYCFTFLMSFIMKIDLNEVEFDLEKIFQPSLDHWKERMDSIQEYQSIGLWTYDILFTAILPLWIMLFWTLWCYVLDSICVNRSASSIGSLVLLFRKGLISSLQSEKIREVQDQPRSQSHHNEKTTNHEKQLELNSLDQNKKNIDSEMT